MGGANAVPRATEESGQEDTDFALPLHVRVADRDAPGANCDPSSPDGDLELSARSRQGNRRSGEWSPTNQRCPNGSRKVPWRCVPHSDW